MVPYLPARPDVPYQHATTQITVYHNSKGELISWGRIAATKTSLVVIASRKTSEAQT
jgi:hypothetical protein